MKNLHLVKLLALSTALSSAPLYAAMLMNPANTLELGLTGGDFLAMTNNGGYAISANDLVSNPPTGDLLKIDPTDKFGAAAYLAYRCGNTPYSYTLSYWYARSNITDVTTGNIAVTSAPATYGIDFATGVSSNENFRNDIGNLALGATYQFDGNFTVTPKIGVTYMHVRNNQTSQFAGSGVPAGAILTVDEPSHFKGFGPSIGADLDYGFGCNFSIFANLAYSALVGDIHAQYAALVSDGSQTATTIDMTTKNTIVGLLQSEIGLSYFFNTSFYAGKGSIGWVMAKAAGTSDNNAQFGDDVGDSNFFSAITNTGFQGPFARLVFNINV